MRPYYEDDLVTLYHGDCLDVDAWLDADVLVTDPPYGQAFRSGKLHHRPDAWRAAAKAPQSIASDESTVARDSVLRLWGQRPAVVFGTWRHPLPEATRPNHRLIWHKAGRKPGISPAPWFPNDEEVWLMGSGWRGKPRGTVITTHEQREREPGRIGHPTPKPVGLMEILIDKAPGGVVADPFAGSGATLVAARNLGRRCVGVELEERYCELIAGRLQQQAFDFGSLDGVEP